MVQNDQTENGPSRPPSKSYSIFNKFKIKKTERSSTFSEAPSTKFSLPLRSSTAGDLESKLSTTTKSRLEIIFAPTQRYPRSKLPTSPEPPESDDIVRGITGALELKIETTELDSTSAGSPNGSKQAEAVPVDAVFRVALVPLGTSLDGFNEAFSTIFPTLLKELTALCNAPNCNAPNRNCNYLIALVQFSKTPDVLEKLPRDASHHFNLAFEPGCTKPVKIKIDRNFQDLTQMYPVEGVISAE